ncbi:MAG: flagellar hook-associated protein FlgK, partial [Comamonas sp.]|nr:flagellar hook-associated protein FlgK [Candidatus Comamonas equi]
MSMLFNGLSGAVASQVALDAVSQNLANALTPNYTRQGVVLTAKSAVNTTLSAGNGVAATSLVRYADSYKTQQMWRANANLGQHEAAQTYLQQLEQVMGDSGSNLSVSLDNFFAALSAASVEPASTPLRQQIIEQAKALGQSVGNLAQIISNQKAAVSQQREVAVDQLNSFTTQIAALNAKIIQANGAGLNTSALQDQRDAQVDGLSKLVGLQTMTQPDGSINLSLRGGQPLVVGDRASSMQVNANSQGYVLEVQFGSEKFALETADWQGTLGGLAAFETDVLNPIDSAVREIAQTIANDFNAVLKAGFGVQGAQMS